MHDRLTENELTYAQSLSYDISSNTVQQKQHFETLSYLLIECEITNASEAVSSEANVAGAGETTDRVRAGGVQAASTVAYQTLIVICSQ